jgi:hypothetical protein
MLHMEFRFSAVKQSKKSRMKRCAVRTQSGCFNVMDVPVSHLNMILTPNSHVGDQIKKNEMGEGGM